ncbi:hypothetical protein AB0K92_29495, partial [Streptomyces sp. NPDC052687]
MTAVVFIHGTGVREPGFSALAGRVAAGLTASRDGLRIVPYYWGGTHGATLAADGASLPPPPGATGRGPALAETPHHPDAAGPDTDVAAWAALYADPYAELALAAAAAPPAVERPPGRQPPEEPLRARLTALPAQVALEEGESADGLARAARELAGHPLLGPAADALAPQELATLAGRALTARVIADALDADAPLVPAGDARVCLNAPVRAGQHRFRLSRRTYPP